MGNTEIMNDQAPQK